MKERKRNGDTRNEPKRRPMLVSRCCWHVGVVMKCLRQRWPIFQLVVLQVKFLGHFPPVVGVKEVVGASLRRVRFVHGLHARRSCHPHSLLFVVPPVPVVPAKGRSEWGRSQTLFFLNNESTYRFCCLHCSTCFQASLSIDISLVTSHRKHFLWLVNNCFCLDPIVNEPGDTHPIH